MNIRFLIILLVLNLSACQSSTNQDSAALKQLKKELVDNPNRENRTALIAEYRTLIKANPSKTSQNAQYLNEIAQLQIENKSFAEAIQNLMEGLHLDKNAPAAADNLWTLGMIYEKYVKSESVTAIIKKLYVQHFPKGQTIKEAQQYVSANTSSIADDIRKLGTNMYDETTHKVNFQTANDYIRVCELYAILKPTDAQSPEYLHKAGETARAIRSFSKAVHVYDWIYKDYPNFEKAPQALFLKAFTYDNDLGNKKLAKDLYQAFLTKYPNDDFADDTQFLLENLGKDDEDIIKGFEESN